MDGDTSAFCDWADNSDPALRLAWKGYVRPVLIGPDHLVILSEDVHHIFQSAAHLRVAPLLADGRYTEAELYARLEEDGVPALSARLAVAHLRALGLVCEVREAPTRRVEEVAFWEALGVDAAAATDNLAHARVVLPDVGGTGVAALRQGLEASRIAVREEAQPGDLVVVVIDDLLDDRLNSFNRSALYTGAAWMTVRLVGTVPWIGPLFVPRETGCWACLAQRLRLNRQTEQFVGSLPGQIAPIPLPAVAWSVALAAQLASIEILRWLGGNGQEGVVGGILALDLKTNELVRHQLTRRPQCSVCGSTWLGHNGRVADVVALGASPKVNHGTAERREPASVILGPLERHISPLTGIVRTITETHENGYLHVAAAHAFPMYRYDFRVLRDNLLGNSGGKGFDPPQARVSALCEALERYSGIWQGEEEPVLPATTRRKLGGDALDVATLLGFSNRQYAERDVWNVDNDDPHAWVPVPFDDDIAIDWVPVWSLTNSRIALAPAAYCYYGHPDLRHQFCAPDSNGCAAGSTLTEATAQALFELVERDAVAIWWCNTVSRPALDLESFSLPILAELREVFRSQGRDFWALDLTSDLGIPVIGAVSARLGEPVEDVIYGFGADFDPAAAATKALLEMNQSLFSVLRGIPGTPIRYRTDRPSALRWFQHATRAGLPYLVPDPTVPTRSPQAITCAPHDDWGDDVSDAVERLQRAGLEVFVLDQTRPDIGLPTCRVIVPGLCHFWRRLGSRRLYDVPVRMGWRTAPRTEDQLNPWFIYF
jgi:ribosomal protein S12 methylthiotransferase accessory factor